jgi:predicted GNAT family N-acyltransferase
MMEQFLQEAGALYEELVIDISDKKMALAFYEKFGFVKSDESFVLRKKLEKKEVIRPTDGYDPTRWMD